MILGFCAIIAFWFIVLIGLGCIVRAVRGPRMYRQYGRRR